MQDVPLRILQLSAASPEKKGDGSASTFAALKAVCQAGHRITYVYPLGKQIHPDMALEDHLLEASQGKLRLIPLTWDPSLVEFCLLWTSYAVLLARLILNGMIWRARILKLELGISLIRLIWNIHDPPKYAKRALQRLLSLGAYDLLQVDYPGVIRYPFGLKTPPKVFVVHEIQTVTVEQMAPNDRPLIDALFQAERASLQCYDAVIALSQEDADHLRTRFGLSHVYYSPLAATLPRILPPVELMSKTGPVRFTFLGGSNHSPNVDAVRWLRAEIFPRLKRTLPGAQMVIIGRYPQDFIKEHADTDFTFTGFVEDLAAALVGSVFLCPIRIGSGMRIKLLDAFFSGVPVISTRVGALGLGLTANEHYWQAENAEEFARQAAYLVENDAVRKASIKAAQEQLTRTFSPEAVAARRSETYRAILEQCKSRASPAG